MDTFYPGKQYLSLECLTFDAISYQHTSFLHISDVQTLLGEPIQQAIASESGIDLVFDSLADIIEGNPSSVLLYRAKCSQWCDKCSFQALVIYMLNMYRIYKWWYH